MAASSGKKGAAMSGRDQLEALRQAIEESEYTVALGKRVFGDEESG